MSLAGCGGMGAVVGRVWAAGRMADPIDPRVWEAVAQLRENPGTRCKVLKSFDRGAPHLLVGLGGRWALIRCNSGEVDASRPQEDIESERWDTWWNSALKKDAVRFCNTPQEALDFAKSNVPPIVIPPVDPPPPPPPDPWLNALSWSMLGKFDSIFTGAPAGAQRLFSSEGDNNLASRRPTVLMNHLVMNTDSPRRCELGCAAEGNNFQEGQTTLLFTEIYFPTDFPSVPTNQYIGVFRFSANVNGVPPLELLVKKRADNTEWVYLRHLGTTHDLASQTTLDTTGGYMWSTPLVRAASATAPNYLFLGLEVKWSVDPAVGWFKVYKDYNLTTPALAQTFGQTLTDTSGTVRCYVRQGINASSSFASNIRVAYAWTNWKITTP